MNKYGEFNTLKPGDIIYAVYNVNYDGFSYTNKFNIEYAISKITVLSNNQREIKTRDYERKIVIKYENVLIINFNSKEYSRRYNSYYLGKSHMTISSTDPTCPTLEIFINKDKAIEYVKDMCNSGISYMESEIEKRKQQINYYKQTIEKCEN